MPFVNIRIVREAIASDPEGKKAAIADKVTSADHRGHGPAARATSGSSSRRSPRATGTSGRRASKRCARAQNERPIGEAPAMTHVARQRPRSSTSSISTRRSTRIATGFKFTEGPIWHPRRRTICCFPTCRATCGGDGTRASGVAEVRRPSNKCNGMTYDADLNLIVCEHATSLLVRERPDGRREILASHFEGKELNSPNDVCVRSDGSIYFTDPWYGRMPGFGVERPRQLGFQGVYRVGTDGAPAAPGRARSLRSAERPLLLARREEALRQRQRRGADPRLRRGGRRLAVGRSRSSPRASARMTKPGVPDGMKCDAAGNVWVTAPGGVWVYAPSGAAHRQAPRPRSRRQSRLGRRRFPHAVPDREPVRSTR